MDAKRWEAVRRIFEAALRRAPSERASFLDDACEGDSALREEVASLVRAHEAEGPVDRLLGALHERPAEKLVQGWRVGPYELIEELGQGGMGQVYRARRADGQFEQEVALKLLGMGLPSPEARERFVAERQILASLSHPNIARLLDGGISDEGQPYFALEVVAGEPIDAYCQTRGCSIEERLKLFLEVCGAVQYAHGKLVVHRDLKPENILVTEEGTVKLLDFGIAKLLDPEAVSSPSMPRTRTGLLPMTPSYASPEQVREEAITVASDVYQLGVVLYELLAGTRPHLVETQRPSEIEQIICEETPEPPSEVARDALGSGGAAPSHEEPRELLRGDLDTIVMKALRKEPERRYESAEQLAEDIQRYLDGHPVRAHPDSWTYRAKKFVQRNRWGVSVIGVIAALIAVSIVALSIQNTQLARERDLAQTEAMKKQHVQDFMVQLFGNAEVLARPEERAAIEQVLERGAERVQKDLADHPAIRADMLRAVAAVHEQMGEYASARSVLDEALTTHRSNYGRVHPEVASTLSDIGDVMRQQGDFEGAERRFREALSIRLELDAEALSLASAQRDLAAVLYEIEHFEEAKTLYEEALPVFREKLGRGHATGADAFATAGAVEAELGNYRRADEYLDEAVAILKTAGRSDHPDLIRYLARRADIVRAQGDFDTAERHLVDAYDRVTKTSDDELGSLQYQIVNQLTGLYMEWEKPERAATYRTLLVTSDD